MNCPFKRTFLVLFYNTECTFENLLLIKIFSGERVDLHAQRGYPGRGAEARTPRPRGLHRPHPHDHHQGQRLLKVHERPPAGTDKFWKKLKYVSPLQIQFFFARYIFLCQIQFFFELYVFVHLELFY